MRVYESIIHALRGLQSPERQGLQETILLLDSPRLRFPLSGVPVLPRYLVAASVKQCPVLRSCVSDLRSTESQQVYTLVADTPYPLSCSRSFCSSLLSSPPLTSTSVTVSLGHIKMGQQEDLQPWATATMASMTVLAFVCVCLRLLSRYERNQKLWWDDWMILWSMVYICPATMTLIDSRRLC